MQPPIEICPLRSAIQFDAAVFGGTEERAAARIHVLLAVGALSLLVKGRWSYQRLTIRVSRSWPSS